MLAAAFSFAVFAPALAQSPSVTKQCGEKWAAAKAAGATEGLTWSKFLGQCRAEMAARPAPVTAGTPAEPANAPAQSAATAAGEPVFPTAVSSKYANATPGGARKQTCLDQYKANKRTNGNGGLQWIAKGGGYYGACNKRLKG